MMEVLEQGRKLPDHHYGGRNGRRTTDPLLLVAQAVKDTWRVKRVANVLYLDVSQAFPNVAHERLLERMEEMGLDEGTVEWTASFLQDHRTSLWFDDGIAPITCIK